MKLSLAIAALAAVGSYSLSAAIIVTVAPQTQTIAPGASTSVQVRISGLGPDTPPSLGAFDFNLAFNPAIVTFTGVTFGDPILGDQLNLSGTGAISDFSLTSPGLLDFFEISLDPATTLDSRQPANFVLATLQFQALARGTTSLVTSLNSVSDSQGNSLTLGFQPGTINVVSAPEPACIWLIPSAGFWILIRRKHGAASPMM